MTSTQNWRHHLLPWSIREVLGLEKGLYYALLSEDPLPADLQSSPVNANPADM